MSDWLRWLLGLGEGEAPAGGETHWELTGMPHGIWLAAASAIVIAALSLILLLYVREKRIGRGQRIVLSALRLGALALVVLILLNPRLLTEIRLERPGKTLFLFDVSSSMSQEDDFEGSEADEVESATGLDVADQPSRTQIGVAAVTRGDIVSRLREKNRVQLFTFGEELAEIGAIETIDDVAALAGETRLGDALLEVSKASARDLIAGIVIVSDGRSNAGEAPLAALREIAARQGAPIFTVGVGRAQLPRNYAIDELDAPSVAEVDSPIQVSAKIRISGLPGEVAVSLYRSVRGDRRRTLVETRKLRVRGQLLDLRLNFVDKIARKGNYRYTLVFPRDPDEIEWRDNRRQADITAAQEKRRVLVVAAQSSREYRYVRNLSLRDDGVQVSCWLASADPGYPQDGDVMITELPTTADELREYDAIVLMDPDPATLTERFQRGLVEFVVDQNGGLVYVAGEVNTATIASDPAYKRLRSLLPVDLARATPTRNRVYDVEWRGTMTPRGATHPICRLDNDAEENLRVWQRLPPFFYEFPASRLRPAGVELAHGKDAVLMAIQRVGVAEVVYLGSDEFWRWRGSRVGYHERFWASMLRYLAIGKLSSGTGKTSVETDRDQYREGEQIRIIAHLIDAQRRPIDRPRVDAIILRSADPSGSQDGDGDETTPGSTKEESWTVGLSPLPGSPGRYAGLMRTPSTGQFEISVDQTGQSYFRVVGLLGESEDPSPDFGLLQQISTESHGRFFKLGELDSLPAAVPERKEIETLGRRAAMVWDSAAMMFLFTGLLVLEWVLRKLWRLN